MREDKRVWEAFGALRDAKRERLRVFDMIKGKNMNKINRKTHEVDLIEFSRNFLSSNLPKTVEIKKLYSYLDQSTQKKKRFLPTFLHDNFKNKRKTLNIKK